MSSEYVCARRAINLYGQSDVYTVLFVQHHSSNTFPHIPRWSVYSFEKQPKAMGVVLEHIHYCDSGLTRGARGGSLSSEQEISRWRDTINAAQLLPHGTKMTVQFSTNPQPFEFAYLPHDRLLQLKGMAEAAGVDMEVADITLRGDAQNKVLRHIAYLDSSIPAHVDLAFAACQPNTNSNAEAKDAKSALVSAHGLFRQIAEDMNHRGLSFAPDPAAAITKTRHSKLDYSDKIFRVLMPLPEIDYTMEVFAVCDASGAMRYSGTNVNAWLCREVLAPAEQAKPGVAQAVYRQLTSLVKEAAVVMADDFSLVIYADPRKGAASTEKYGWLEQDIAGIYERAQPLPDGGGFLVAREDRLKVLTNGDYFDGRLLVEGQEQDHKPGGKNTSPDLDTDAESESMLVPFAG